MTKKNKSKNSKGIGKLFTGLALLAVATSAGVYVGVGHVDEDLARNILENDAKLENVALLGKASISDCRGNISMRAKFSAISNGKPVTGVVCDGLVYPAFVRFTPSAK